MIFKTVGWTVSRIADSIDQNRSLETLSTQTLINIKSPAVIRHPGAPAITVQEILILAPDTHAITELRASKVVLNDLDKVSAVNEGRVGVGFWASELSGVRVGWGDYNCGG